MKYNLSITSVLLIILFSTNYSKAQTDSSITARNVIFIEGLGIGGYGSLNYERIIPLEEKINLSLRIGLSTYQITDYTRDLNPDIIIPAGINASYGKKHRVTLGIGQTIVNTVQANNTTFEPERTTVLHPNFSIGYRFHKSTGGLYFNLTYTPLIEYYKYFRHWAGIAIGYSF